MESVQLKRILGENLQRLRESRKQSRQAFAAECGIVADTVQSYELGYKCPSLKRFLTLCRAFEVSPNILLDGMFQWRTELDETRELERLASDLTGQKAQKLKEFQNIYLRDTIETRPWLLGAPFGTRLHILRKESQLTIGTLADKCLISKSTMQGYESGQYDPPLPVMLRLCETFGVSPEYLLAPYLQRLSYADPRIADLRPMQIKTLLALSQFFKNNL